MKPEECSHNQVVKFTGDLPGFYGGRVVGKPFPSTVDDTPDNWSVCVRAGGQEDTCLSIFVRDLQTTTQEELWFSLPLRMRIKVTPETVGVYLRGRK